MSQLTQQIAAAYIGAQVEWTNRKWDIYSYGRDGVQINALVVPYDQCRLILTPLSHITDEDEIQVGRIARPEIKDVHHLRNIGTNIIADIINGHSLLEIGFVSIQHIIDYLRSRNYDLGYMGIRSLIDAGIAISSLDKTETK